MTKTVDGESPNSYVLMDGMRGVGAFVVLIGHTMAFWANIPVGAAYVVVDFFFILSGFIIAYSYEPRLAKGLGIGDFMHQRVVRLFPIYVLGVITTFVVLAALAVQSATPESRLSQLVAELAPELFMLPAPVTHDGLLYPLNMPAWTLLFEMIVNLVFVLIWRWLSTPVLIALLLALALALGYHVFLTDGVDKGQNWDELLGGLLRAGFGFFGGVLIYRLSGRPKGPTTRRSWLSFVFLAIIPLMYFVEVPPKYLPISDIALVMVFGLAFVALSQRYHPSKRWWALFAWGGRVSYPIYALHFTAVELATRMAWKWPELTSTYRPLGGVAILIAVTLWAHLAEKYYDRPLRRWWMSKLKKKAPSRGSPTAPAAVAPEITARRPAE
ncbi:MAG: acyltransferase [Hyphomonadaceae bacterium]